MLRQEMSHNIRERKKGCTNVKRMVSWAINILKQNVTVQAVTRSLFKVARSTFRFSFACNTGTYKSRRKCHRKFTFDARVFHSEGNSQ